MLLAACSATHSACSATNSACSATNSACSATNSAYSATNSAAYSAYAPTTLTTLRHTTLYPKSMDNINCLINNRFSTCGFYFFFYFCACGFFFCFFFYSACGFYFFFYFCACGFFCFFFYFCVRPGYPYHPYVLHLTQF